MRTAHIGDSVFKMPVTELCKRVCAKANKKAGIKMPIMPDKNNFMGSFFFNSPHRRKANGNKKIAAAATRNEPTSAGENTFNPCLMRIKEVPQIRERTMSKSMALPLLLFSGMILNSFHSLLNIGYRYILHFRFIIDCNEENYFVYYLKIGYNSSASRFAFALRRNRHSDLITL